MSDLIERLENLEFPDREVDAMIAAALEPHRFDAPGFTPIRPIPTFQIDKAEGAIRFDDGGIMDLVYFPAVTRRIDAAVGLCQRVLPGWHWHIGSCPDDFLTDIDRPFTAELMGPVSYAVLDREIGEEPVFDSAHASAVSAPIALCIAILRAARPAKSEVDEKNSGDNSS